MHPGMICSIMAPQTGHKDYRRPPINNRVVITVNHSLRSESRCLLASDTILIYWPRVPYSAKIVRYNNIPAAPGVKHITDSPASAG